MNPTLRQERQDPLDHADLHKASECGVPESSECGFRESVGQCVGQETYPCTRRVPKVGRSFALCDRAPNTLVP